jgi:hypothetical protein
MEAATDHIRAEGVLVHRRSGPRARGFDGELELAGGESIDSPLLPGFALDVGDLFRRGP